MLVKWLTEKFPFLEWIVYPTIYIVCFLCGPWALFQRYKFFRNAIVVEGIITATFREYGGEFAEVEYIFDGKKLTSVVDWIASINGNDKGKHVKLMLNPQNIQEVQVRQFSAGLQIWVLTIFWVAMTVCLIVLACIGF